MKSSITLLEVFCKAFVDVSYDNTSFLILEDTNWYQTSCIQKFSLEILIFCMSVGILQARTQRKEETMELNFECLQM